MLESESPRHWGAEVGEVEVLGHPCPSFLQRPRAVPQIFLDARRFPDRTYLVEGDRRLSFGAHEAAVERVAGALQEHGVGRGDRVLLLGSNSMEWVIAFWAVLGCGAIVVLGNAWWSEAEVAHAVSAVEPRLALVDERRRSLLPRSQEHLTFGEVREVHESPAPSRSSRVEIAEDDPAIILFTSGTTGAPKGAVLTHRGVLATLQSLLLRTNRLPVEGVDPAPASTALLSLPLFHIGGLQQIITPVVTGGRLVFSEGRFDPGEIVALIEREGVRVWSAVPTMANRVMDHLEETRHPPLAGVRTVGLGGSPVREELRDRIRRWFPDAARGLAVTYGLSEAGGVVATAVGEAVARRPGTVGRPLATAVVRIDEPDERGHGEVLVRSPSIMLGYWAGASRDGAQLDPGPVTEDRWLRTGDIGYLDDDGYLSITDRSKDIVIRGGENIATPHVEDVLMQHPAVREVAVVGLPHAELGEELGATVVVKDGASAGDGDLEAFARRHLAYFEVPTRWRFVQGPLPQNATGKVIKRTVRERWMRELEAEGTP